MFCSNVSSGSDSTVNFLCLQEEKGLSYNIDESEDSSLTDEFDQHLYEQCRKQADSSHSIHALTGSNHSENQQTENNREISHTQTLQSKSSEKICFSKKATCSRYSFVSRNHFYSKTFKMYLSIYLYKLILVSYFMIYWFLFL